MAGGNRKQCDRSPYLQPAQEAGRGPDQNRARNWLRRGESVMLASIRGRLMLLVFASIALVWGVALVASYRQTTHEVEVWENARLAELARMLAQLNQDALVSLSRTTIDAREEEDGSAAGNSDDEDSLPRNV